MGDKFYTVREKIKRISIVLFAACACSHAIDITVAWDPSTTATDGAPLNNVICYKLFYSETSGSFSNYVEVTDTSAVVTGLEFNKTYYFCVKAFTEQTESDFSGELVWNSPVMADSDHDQISDDWELEHFGSLTVANGTTDSDNNGVLDQIEFIAGTDPNNAADLPDLSLIAQTTISFEARLPDGDGYQNRDRTYCLMYCEDLSSGVWTPVPGMENIPAANQQITYEISPELRSGFFRTDIQLN